MIENKLDIANYNPGKPLVIQCRGVDSSVAAVLLKNAGYECSALFMKSWDERIGGSCRWEDDVTDALHICEKLKIEINTVDFTAEYETSIQRFYKKAILKVSHPTQILSVTKKQI
ncbi:MAG: hypothetical protein CM15mP58_23210 [Burkholderiaceae bacterium]|nr:MAG: hypothetical protein CM15mP58_23210 [Burkholderiaceae bacterium]